MQCSNGLIRHSLPQYLQFLLNFRPLLTPSEPIKAYEFKIEFDPLLLEANSVTEGNFFDGYTTFFIPGIIQQEQGRIINIYDLIIGPGNVSTPGIFVVIQFTAKTQTGLSHIHIYDEGITNETRYLSVDVHDGNVQIYGMYFPWDTNEDNRINYMDISMVVSHYLDICPLGNEPWDIIKDGIVNHMDISILCGHYGESY